MDGLVARGRMKDEGRIMNPEPGDLVGFKVGGCINHLGIVLRGKRFVHCWLGRGVIISRLDDATFAKRISRIWRPL